MSEPIDVLIVDDDSSIRIIVANVCAELGWCVREADTIAAAEEELAGRHCHLVVLDLNLPDASGLELLARLRARARVRTSGIVVLTGDDRPQERLEAVRLGALDFVAKPFRLVDLRHRLERAVRAVALEQRLRSAEERLVIERTVDGVTGVGAAALLFRILEAEFHAALVGERPLACVIVSDEGYDQALQVGGEDAGSERLRALARLIEQRLRGTDRIFRVDAAEFVILLPGAAPAGARHVVEKIADSARQVTGLSPESLAIAVATYPHPEIAQASQLYRAANISLAQARAAGRTRFFGGF